MLTAEERIDLYLEGELPECEWDTLQQWLQNPDNQQRFLRRVELHADLRRSLTRQHLQQSALQEANLQEAGLQESNLPDAKMHGANLSEPANRRRLWLLFATPLALLVLMSLGIPQPPREPTSSVTSSDTVALARIEYEVNARLRQGAAVWPQASLPPGEYSLDQGLLQLRYARGVMVYMEAAARVEAVSRSVVGLHEGRWSASVPPAGIGVTVETPDAEVVDFGTEFSVDVASGASEVHVFAGQVRVQPKQMDDPQAHSVDLRTSQAVKVKAAEQTVDIALARDRFIRGFDEPKVVYRRTVRRLQPADHHAHLRRPVGQHRGPPRRVHLAGPGNPHRHPHRHVLRRHPAGPEQRQRGVPQRVLHRPDRRLRRVLRMQADPLPHLQYQPLLRHQTGSISKLTKIAAWAISVTPAPDGFSTASPPRFTSTETRP